MPRGYKEKDITGMKFGRLTAIERAGTTKGRVIWKFLCDCGNIHYTYKSKVVCGKTLSCGCLLRERVIEGNHRRWKRKTSEECDSVA